MVDTPYINHNNVAIRGVIMHIDGFFRLIFRYSSKRGIKRAGTANDPVIYHISTA